MRAARASPWASLLAVTAAACATLPPAAFPPSDERSVLAEFVAPADGRIRLPASGRDLTVEQLRVEPPPIAELVVLLGGRWLRFAPGTGVLVFCRYRAYAATAAELPTPATLFAAAHRLSHGIPAP